MTLPDDASLAQTDAADPSASTWLSANAGSGKTRVLTDRVARLLLRGAPPQNILCLTYTKAAAGEMQNRLFRTLGGWSMMPDEALDRTLSRIGARAGVRLGEARTLFARAIETPGGLKIQTIHSFCAALLRQFPLEAGVSPGFAEMDESAQHHLLADVLEALAEQDPSGAVTEIARYHSGHEIERFVADIVNAREKFRTGPTRSGILRVLGAPESLTAEELARQLACDAALIGRLQSALKSGSTRDIEAFDKLDRIDPRHLEPKDLPVLESVFLRGKGSDRFGPFSSKAGAFPTKDTRAELVAGDLAALDAFMDRVESARPLRLALEAAERTLALHGFAAHLLPAYSAAKARRGWLDFDDLIEKATALLSDTEAAAWVSYRLDARIDHVLVDESQDTSPAQWRMIALLTEEFGTGESARTDADRTLFVVGDKKQSIYSFQGADAEAFDAMAAAFGERLAAAGGLRRRALLHSFRSAPAILRAVDATFGGGAGEGLGEAPRHIAFHEGRPGRVDLWPLVPTPRTEKEGVWYDPVDLVAPDSPSLLLAEKVAGEIGSMIADPSAVVADDAGPRRLHAGDFLILVPGRTGQRDLFQALIRACKTAGLAVAGADVMRLDEELAVRDLRALLAFLALPEDSLSLAAILRSPLFGWSEDALYRLAAGRGEPYLWRELRDRAAEFPETVAVLDDLRDKADYLRPYELLERMLVRHGGRRRLIGRLGQECEEAIDEMLTLALGYERQEVPSLTGFLAWLDGEATEVKRPAEQAGRSIRVMTVHGAKGLESPVVILPDTMRSDQRRPEAIIDDGDGTPHWQGARADQPDALSEAADALARRNALERQRLLYVAMTRAESWLIVCGMGDAEKAGGTWYGAVQAGLLATGGASPCETPFGQGLRLQTGDWSAREEAETTEAWPDETPLPDWTARPAPALLQAAARSPSDLGGVKALPGEGRSEEEALRHGRQMHLLLEHLPGLSPEGREEMAVALLAEGDDVAPEKEARALARTVSELLAAPGLAGLFSGEALAEVDVSAAIPELDGARIHGVIDRLILDDDRVLVVDFKTNAVVPGRTEDVPEGILRQMGAYRSAVGQIYPDRRIDIAVLWTTTAALMPLSHEIVMQALARTTTS